MAMPYSFAASITSWSRTEPPGWITAVAPASAAASRPSRNGKNASLAHAPPRARPAAFSAAIRPASRRFCCPAPTPTAWPSFTSTMVFDVTRAHTFHANSRSTHSASVGARSVTTRQVLRSSDTRSRVCTSRPPSMERRSSAGQVGGCASMTRRFFFAVSTASASGSKPGATTTSVNTGDSASASALGTTRLMATMPPNAETSSH